MLLILVLLLLFVGYSLVECAAHRRNLLRVPVRVQVNGTRGKSSVTRLIAAGLRAGGMRVVAKTTGTKPRFITGDDEERPVRRLGKANIAEQLRMVRLARRHRAEALVFENMSLVPEYQAIERRLLLRPTHAVVTNVRADHLDVMGPTIRDVARALGSTVPRRGLFFTTQREYLPILCRRAGPELETVVTDGSDVDDGMLGGFGYVEHRENVSLALAVCERLGIERGVALAGMQRTTPDPGAMRIHALRAGTKCFELVNTLAANDPDSIRLLWGMMEQRAPRRVVLVNCRSDRTDRSRQLAELAAGWDAELFVATGGLTRVFLRRARQLDVPADRLVDLGDELPPPEVFAQVALRVPDGALVFATGNTVGYGDELIRCFVEMGRVDDR